MAPTGVRDPDTLPYIPIRDALETETSEAQDETFDLCLPLLSVSVEGAELELAGQAEGTVYARELPRLERQRHVAFLEGALGTLPSAFVAVDASRPWLFYWTLTGLQLLGQDVSSYRARLLSTLTPMQNADGGFGGGHGHLSHCATSYAVVLSLAMVGGEAALGLVDRPGLWRWLGQLKQPDGGFTLTVGGEEDVRGAYCAMVMIDLLRLPLELPSGAPARRHDGDTFATGLAEYLSRCQTFDGGVSGSPDAEAHGAYAFCALACLSMMGHPRDMLPRSLNVPRLISWLSARQNGPEGGFSGRTNKLVDGCYSHWVGGCWPLIEAALKRSPSRAPVDLYSREGLIRYILCCCQDHRGGLRDKPGKRPDAYHTCYTLAGLSSAQHRYWIEQPVAAGLETRSSPAFWWAGSPSSPEDAESDADALTFGPEEDRVALMHPIFVLPWGVAERTRSHFEAQPSVDTSTAATSSRPKWGSGASGEEGDPHVLR